MILLTRLLPEAKMARVAINPQMIVRVQSENGTTIVLTSEPVVEVVDTFEDVIKVITEA